MATTAIAGYSGTISGVGSNAEVTKWEIKVTAKKLDATSFASGGWRDYVVGLIGATGSADTNTPPPAQGTTASISFTTTAVTITGSAIITKAATTTDVSGKVTHSVEFKFTGEPSVTPAA